MHSGPLRVLEIYGDPTDFGRTHGLECAEMIGAYLADRLGLSGDPTWAGHTANRETILELAKSTLPFHRDYSPSLYEELEALSAAAGISPAEAILVGGFTDLVDIIRAQTGTAPVEDDCTAVLDPTRGVFAQTWDMHASAGRYVLMLKLDPIKGPGAVVQTTAGCLGQIGMNEAGIGIGINNLTSYGKPGVTWNFVVRKALQQTDFDAAVECVTRRVEHDLVASKADGSLGLLVHASEDLDEGRLAGAVIAKHAGDLARGDRRGHAAEGGDAAVELREVVELQEWLIRHWCSP